MASEERIGEVFKYFQKAGVAAVKITAGTLNNGDRIRITGASTDFTQTVESMQADNDPVTSASAGDNVGIKTIDRVREGDRVYRILED